MSGTSLENEVIKLAGPAVTAKYKTHESGHPMIFFPSFRPETVSGEAFDVLFATAKTRFGREVTVIGLHLRADQAAERVMLEELGFKVDGVEYGVPVAQLAASLRSAQRSELPSGFEVLPMVYERDIDEVVELEKSVHAADLSSRVKFDTPEAINGMRGYYKKGCDRKGVFVLRYEGKLAGLIGFLPDEAREDAVHISSASISLDLQGRGLFFPFLLQSLKISDLADRAMLTALTSTARLIEAAKRYALKPLGWSLSRREAGS